MHNKTFIHQLHAILNEPELEQSIRWSKEDDGVFILKPYDRQFSTLVLKRYFKHGNVSSFVRQLHMYGFHKLSNVPEQHTSAHQVKDKSQTVWHFTHPLGLFTKDATAATLNKIPRKSTGVGKDGKRKNVLSTVCVNYISQGDRAASPLSSEERLPNGNASAPGVPSASSFLQDRQHYSSLPLLPPTRPYSQEQPHPLLPHLQVREQFFERSRAISSPEVVQRPLPQPQVYTSTPTYSLPPPWLYTPSSSVSSVPFSSPDHQQLLQGSVQLLEKTMASVVELLPSLCRRPLSQSDCQQVLHTVHSLKRELLAHHDSRSRGTSFNAPPSFPGGPMVDMEGHKNPWCDS